jgi:flavin reductase (DIM6/NTAB) family NADH-FMN oxidoreductase RutF
MLVKSAGPDAGRAKPIGDGVNPDTFRDACSRMVTSVSVATVLGPGGEPQGLTISSFTPVSLEPPLILISIGNETPLLDYFLQSEWFAVSVLGEAQQGIAAAFAEKPEGRFDGVSWNQGVYGQPLIDGSVAAFECRRTGEYRAGDHTVVFGEVVRVRVAEGKPLLYGARGYRRLAL